VRDVSAFDFDAVEDLKLFKMLVNRGLTLCASVFLHGGEYVQNVVDELM